MSNDEVQGQQQLQEEFESLRGFAEFEERGRKTVVLATSSVLRQRRPLLFIPQLVLDEALDLDPGIGIAHFNKASILVSLGYLPAGREALGRAREQHVAEDSIRELEAAIEQADCGNL